VIRIRCPICHERLLPDIHSMVCSGHHRFDRAREGYLNLLTVQQKNSLDPGDDADMVAARRSFLEAGYYAPFRDTLKAIIEPLHAGVLLDSGCGEGWYTQMMREVSSEIVALDISKHAMKRAAKRMADTTWLVSSSNDIPLFDHSVDVMTAIFSPVQVAEADRILDDYGTLVIAAPGEKHLWELREALYPEVRAHEPEKWLGRFGRGVYLAIRNRPAFFLHVAGQRRRTQPVAHDPALLARVTRATHAGRNDGVAHLTGRLQDIAVQKKRWRPRDDLNVRPAP
jgi:23S rRNA (guanine745-N1)-methyltransferase